MDPKGELVAAAIVDERVWDVYGDSSADGIFLTGQPGPALPFVMFRAWKVGVGIVEEEVRLFGPSGRMVWRWGPEYRRMQGMFDLTTEVDTVHDAVFDETGTYVASFIIDEQIVGEIELPVYVQAAPTKLPKETEDGLKKSDVIWVGVERDGRRTTIPAWFVYRNGKIYVLSSKEPSLEEQTVPGLPDANDVIVITRRKYRDTSLDRFRAVSRILEGREWDQAAALLADRRRSRVGPPQDSIKRWKGSCVIAELTPLIS
jgi:hypothetical protein